MFLKHRFKLLTFYPQQRWIRQFIGRFLLILALLMLLPACFNRMVEQATLPPGVATHPIEHVMGVTEVPEHPERVVVLDTAALDAVLALDIKPIGATVYETFPDYLGDRTAGIINLGEMAQPNLEKIIQLQPDLILSNQLGSKSIYRQLAKIAPTIFAESSGRDGDWPENFRLYAAALNQTEKAEQVLADYQQTVENLKQQIGNPEETVVSVVFSYQNYIGFYSDASFSGSVLSDLGLARPPIQTRPETAPHLSVVSKEAFTELDGDLIFLMVGLESPLTLDQFMNDPLYSRLSAVKKNQVYPVQSAVWSAGRNILAARQIMQDVAQALME
ncbi:MAG: iron-siderophore ABC transporter substrate-binding protein [Cyanobacteria bacterium P01_G01_bin.54]